MNIRNPHLAPVAILVVLFVFLGGCSSSAEKEAPEASGVRVQPLQVSGKTSDFDRFIQASSEGAVAIVEDSPWGAHVELAVQKRYFAASGRHCAWVELLNAQATTEPKLVCQETNGQWKAVRVLAQP